MSNNSEKLSCYGLRELCSIYFSLVEVAIQLREKTLWKNTSIRACVRNGRGFLKMAADQRSDYKNILLSTRWKRSISWRREIEIALKSQLDIGFQDSCEFSRFLFNQTHSLLKQPLHWMSPVILAWSSFFLFVFLSYWKQRFVSVFITQLTFSIDKLTS